MLFLLFMMKQMLVGLSLVIAGIFADVQAQTSSPITPANRWTIQVGSGTLLYLGDVAYKFPAGRMTPNLHFGIERRFSKGLALNASLTKGNITANDRLSAGGKLLQDNPNFSRSLNFKTKITSGFASLYYYANNGYLLSETATVYPFLFAGAGITRFQVFVDQFFGDKNNYNRYYYWSDGTIRDLPEGSSIPANIKKQDGIFETEVTSLKTENTIEPNTAITLPVGVGLGFRFSDNWSAHIASSMMFMFTDNLDGVGGTYATSYDQEVTEYVALPNPNYVNGSIPLKEQYRGNPNNKKDKVINTSLTINYHFGGKYREELGPIVKIDTASAVATAKKPAPVPVKPKTILTPPDSLKLDPFATANKKKDFVYREREEKVVFTNTLGKKDTMIVMRIDTLSRSEAIAMGGTTSKGPQRAMNYTTLDGGTGTNKAMDDDIIKDVYKQLQKLNESLNGLEARTAQIEKKLNNADAKVNNAEEKDNTSSFLNNMQSVVLFFPTASSDLDDESAKKLATVAGILAKYPNLGVMLNGYADPSGDPVKNLMLSQERVDMVRNGLLARSAKNYQIICQFHGSENKRGAADPSKRRVEIEFIKVR
ncbi:MAG: OmpA family protein [Bacteroidia bacterium]